MRQRMRRAMAATVACGAMLVGGPVAWAQPPAANAPSAFSDLTRTGAAIVSRVRSTIERVLPSSPAPVPQAGEFHHGMSLMGWSDAELSSDKLAATIASLKAIGVDSVAVVVTAFMADDTSVAFEPETRPSRRVLAGALDQLARARLHILLKPHVDTRRGAWRGAIRPSSWAAWHAAYAIYILGMADLARAHGVEILAVGTELDSAITNPLPWRRLIERVRARFSGKLTYASNWDDYFRVGFWSSLDYMGIDAYFPLAHGDGNDPAGFERAWRVWAGLIGAQARLVHKPVLLTEIGYRPVAWGARAPFDNASAGVPDPSVQASAYAAARKVLSRESWLAGIYPWGWGDPDPTGYSPADSSALQVLAGWYRGLSGGATD